MRLEPGVQSGRQPTEARQISSIVGDMLTVDGAANQLDVSELEPFSMTLLHFRRTFVEKLFAIHGKVERLKQEGVPLGRDVRHYAGLFVLAGRPEVLDMLASPEYESIRLDYDEKSRAYFANSHRPPKGLRFASSDAMFPSEDLQAASSQATKKSVAGCSSGRPRPSPRCWNASRASGSCCSAR